MLPENYSLVIAIGLVALIGFSMFWHIRKFHTMARRYPLKELGEGADTREKQTLTIGNANMGNNLTLSRDDQYIHIMPSGFFKLLGAPASSLPIARMQIVLEEEDWAEVQIGIRRIHGPRWLLAPSKGSAGPPGDAKPPS